jgi:hypothetical protein
MSTQIESHEAGEHADTAITIRTMELVVGALLAALAVLVIYSNYQIGAGWAEDGPEAGYFPLRMGIFILLASIVVIVQAVLKNDTSRFVGRQQLRLVATVLVPLVLYVGAIQLLGIYVASTLFIGIFMMAVGKFSWWKSLAISAGISLTLFWVFEIQFMVPLPKGPLEQLFGF